MISKTFARGFLLTTEKEGTLRYKLFDRPYFDNLRAWVHTYFGPCTLWHDPLLNYATERDNQHGVGIMGLCVNPFDGLSSNRAIAGALYKALKSGRTAFLDYVDQLTGAFIIIYRENADVVVIQDSAATKPVYYHVLPGGGLTATSHAAICAKLHDLSPDPRVAQIYEDETYRKDPSRYLPGLITPYSGLLPLTANSELLVSNGRSRRFFPREALPPREFGPEIVDEIASIMLRQAELLGSLGRPLHLAATGGRDSRVSAATFTEQPNLRYFSFHNTVTGNLADDVRIARMLAEAAGIGIDIYDLENYNSKEFNEAFSVHSPKCIWPAAALCYLTEFAPDTIHIRSTVSEIGRVFYSRRVTDTVTPEALANSYTSTDFSKSPLVIDAMRKYIGWTHFDTAHFFNYNLYDMYYWEHRNSKWQNVLCSEAEMATDVFIPYNNRNLLKLFLSVPFKNRQAANVHLALCRKLQPQFDTVQIML